jgi:ferredoxin-NADP reductase
VETTLSAVLPQTPSAATLRLDLGGAAFPYRPGQHVALDPHQFEALAPAIAAREAERGKREGLAYFSLSSDGLDPSSIEITVKDAGGVLAPFLVRKARPGLKVSVGAAAGGYVLPDPEAGVDGCLHLCAGSGVAPNRGILRHALGRGDPRRHLLVLQDRGPGDVLFRADWEDLRARHRDRFRVRHVYSRSVGERVDESLLRREMGGYLEPGRMVALICGPNQGQGRPGFVDDWRARLAAMGILRIVTEGA